VNWAGSHDMSDETTTPIRIEPWEVGDLALLNQLVGDPRMMEHLGGPEAPAKIVERNARYVQTRTDAGRVFKAVVAETGEAVGFVGYWEREWNGGWIYEAGWSVIPAFQRRGVAAAATALALAAARDDGKHRFVHAFPSVENAASNAICRRLGFELLGAHDFEYPPGNPMRCNDWRLDLG
jgi:RimJ/RimL family protein N-acetyltransferase